MIYTVTFNPSLDYIVSVEDFKLGLTNRTSSELMLPGGKGLNVSMVLGNLGIENTALGFVAGFTGEEIVRRIEQMGVRADLIRISNGISRINVKLQSIDGTEINGCGPQISERHVQELLEKLDILGAGDPCRKHSQLYAGRYVQKDHGAAGRPGCDDRSGCHERSAGQCTDVSSFSGKTEQP